MSSPIPRDARIVVASRNPGKLREIQQILSRVSSSIIDLSGFGPVEFPEEGADYRENALAKARAAAGQLGEWALADDSGLEVDGLDGAPGPYSARYGGPGLDDRGRVQHLLQALTERPGASRAARFVCWAALVGPDASSWCAFGGCGGIILESPHGAGGFGYDPVFRPDGFEASMAELADETKCRISHRARALEALIHAAKLTPRAATDGP